MLISKCVVLIFIVALLEVVVTASENESNINLLKNEISEAMKDCGESKEYRQTAKEVFEKKSKNPTAKIIAYQNEDDKKTRPNEETDDAQMNRKKRNVLFSEKLQKSFGLRSIDESNSGEWDYDDNTKSGTNGESWNDPKDDTSIFDSVYGHERRNNSNRYGNNGNNEKRPNDNNSTRYNYQSDSGNNFDSRGAKMVPVFGKLFNDKFPKSVRDLNLTSNLYDPFMTRGIWSTREALDRVKRYDTLIKNSNENECLSQCVFTNLQIVDDRGIPKEILFTKLLQGSITSLQTRMVLEGQLQTCFDELASESEDNGCSYSNALDRCMGLQLRKRKSLANEAQESESAKVDKRK